MSAPLHNINFYFLFLFVFFLFKSHIIQYVLFKHLLAIFGFLFKPTDVIYILKVLCHSVTIVYSF